MVVALPTAMKRQDCQRVHVGVAEDHSPAVPAVVAGLGFQQVVGITVEVEGGSRAEIAGEAERYYLIVGL